MIAKWTIVILVSVVLLGAVGAWAASLSVSGVDDLGSGSATVDAPAGVSVTDVEWFLDPSDSSTVIQYRVTFAAVSPNPCTASDPCTLYLSLKDTGGTVLQQAGPLSLTLSTITTTTVGVNGTLSVSAASITKFFMTVTQEA